MQRKEIVHQRKPKERKEKLRKRVKKRRIPQKYLV